MTTLLQSYFDKAELALGAYSDFSKIARTPNGSLDSNQVKDTLSEIPEGGVVSDFSVTEADKFLTRFEVLDQFTADPLTNGFSATVFRDKSTGQIYFVNRGTNDLVSDIVTD